MKLFLDANVLVSVLNKEYPAFTYNARILSLSDSSRYKLFTSPLCLAIAFYFAEKKSGTTLAKKKVDLLCKHVSIASNSSESVKKTLLNPAIHDFEDGLEYHAALENGCECIITADGSDYYFSDLEVLSPSEFCSRYLIVGP